MTGIVRIADADFAWLLRKDPRRRGGLHVPPGGVDDTQTLSVIREMTRRLHERDCRLSWMIVSCGEVVGLCGVKDPPKDGAVEIGYGIAASRRGHGHATDAVASVLDTIRHDARVRLVTAETTTINTASQRVLVKNGFVRIGDREDRDDGPLFIWHRNLGN